MQTELRLHPGVCLPAELCEKMVDAMQREGFDFRDENAGVFADADRARLRNVAVRGCSITDRGMEILLRWGILILCLNTTQELAV